MGRRGFIGGKKYWSAMRICGVDRAWRKRRPRSSCETGEMESRGKKESGDHLPDSLAGPVSGFPGRDCFGYWLMRHTMR